MSAEEEIRIVMEYTGWTRQMACAAISQWRTLDPGWTASYILVYLGRANETR